MNRLVALVREISPAIGDCQLTHLERQPIDVDRARRQHDAYRETLTRLGCSVQMLGADRRMPDSVFIEDTAVVVDEIAVIARPGAATRRIETAGVRAALSAYRPLIDMTAPATLDGGDVIVAGRQVFVGRSSRTNQEGIDQLSRALAPFGYRTREVAVRDCLHLKSAATAVNDDTLVIDPRWAPSAAFEGLRLIEIDPHEPGAANVVRVGLTCLAAAAFPRTCARLEQHGFTVATVPCDELAKAEGAVSCCSLILRVAQ